MIAGYPVLAAIFFERILPVETDCYQRSWLKVFHVNEYANRSETKTGSATAIMSALPPMEFRLDKPATKSATAVLNSTSGAKGKENTRRIAGKRSTAAKDHIFQRKCCQ